MHARQALHIPDPRSGFVFWVCSSPPPDVFRFGFVRSSPPLLLARGCFAFLIMC